MTIRHPSEHQEQRTYFKWLRLQHREVALLAAAVPNGTWTPSQAARGRAKAEGVSTGYPDILIDLPRGPYHGLRIEMKRRRKSLSSVSDAQNEWLTRLREQGFYATVCYGFEEARATTETYLAYGPFDGRTA